MIEDRTKMLATTLHKLYKRGAKKNIKKILAKSHIVDTAEALVHLHEEEAYAIFRLEPSIEKRSEVLSYLSSDLQKYFIERQTKTESAALLTAMETDDIADILGQLDEKDSQEILESMDKEDSEEVSDLMGYPEDSAGGLMGSDILALSEEMTVAEAIKAIQSDEGESAVTFYLYVVDETSHLVGVVNLKELLLSKPTEPLKKIMESSVITVNVQTDQEEVAKVVERYDFLSVPVVDDDNILVGVITVDDVIDVIREEAEEDLLAVGQAGWGIDLTLGEHFLSRMPWIILAFIGGGICFAILYIFGLVAHWVVPESSAIISYIPLLLSVVSITGGQSASIIGGALRMGVFEQRKLSKYLFKEVLLSVLMGPILAALVLVLGYWLVPGWGWNFVLPLTMAVSVIISMFIGTLVPVGLHKVGIDVTSASTPITEVLVNILSVAALLSIYHAQ